MTSPSSDQPDRTPASPRKGVPGSTAPDGKAKPKARRKVTPKGRPVSPRMARGAGDLTIKTALKRLRMPDLKAPYRFWCGEESAPMPARVGDVRSQLEIWMGEPERVAARARALDDAQRAVLEALLGAPKHRRTAGELAAQVGDGAETEGVNQLARAGIVFADPVEPDAEPSYAVPSDLANALLVQAIADNARSIHGVLTLKGHLDQRYAGPDVARPMPPARLREMFKMYANEAAAVARVERLPEGLRDLVGQIVLEFGGLLPRSFFERMETELPHWNQRRWAKILGESLVGTVERLELTPYGIQYDDDTLIVFNEVTLAWFKRVAVPSDPDAPHDDASLGVDLLANVSRFFAYLIDNSVRFTVKGEIFKTTEKRILTELIPNPGRELERGDVLHFIFYFARSAGLIEVTGERTFKLTTAGREWEAQDLERKLSDLFDHVIHDRDEAHESIHHPAMRRVLAKMMKRLEVGTWYDVMYLPFLARNAYLAQLDSLGVADWVQGRGASGAGASEDLQRLSWNLVNWVRKRLYLLGIVDLGYDSQGHPVAMRLTRIGARVLGMDEPEREEVGIGRLVVTPDFEVVLFHDGDDADLTHDLDRFCDRTKDGALRQFKLSDRSIHRGLVEGMTMARMCEVLTANSRTPVPRNVLHSIRGWALQGGLMMLGEDHVIRAQDPELMARFSRDAGVRPFIRSTLDATTVQLKSKTSRNRYRTLLRELGYLVELDA